MASFEELYPSMAKRLFKTAEEMDSDDQNAVEHKYVLDLPGERVKEDEPREELVDLGGRLSTQELAGQWMTVKEASEALDMVTMTIYRMIKRGELRSTRFGPRRIRVFRPDVNAILTNEESK